MPRFKMKYHKLSDEDQGTDGDTNTSITNDYEKTLPSSSSISALLTCSSKSSSTCCPEMPLLLSTENEHDCAMIENTKANIYSCLSSSSTYPQQPSVFSTSSYFSIKNDNCNNQSRHELRLQLPSSTYSCSSKENGIVISSSVSDGPKGYYEAARPNQPTAPSSLSSVLEIMSVSVLENKTNRDIPVMESCQTRTLIVDHDDSANPNNRSKIATQNAISSSALSSSSVCFSNYSTSNYYPCTDHGNQEKTTMVIASVTAILTTLLMTSFKLLWWSHYHHYHNNHRQQNSKTNYHNNLRSSARGKTPANGMLSFFTSLIFMHGLLGSYLGFITLVHGQPPPLPPAGFLDFDNLPVTRFSCEGKVIGGYYADVETGCQMFHVCTLGQKDEIQDIKFLCLNGTVFDQETRVCERVDEVDCSKAEQFFDLNLDLYVPHATTQKPEDADLEEEDDIIRPVQSKSPAKAAPSSTSTTTRAPPPTTTTTTSTPSPRTRPPTPPPSPPRSRTPVISSSSQQSSSSDEEEEEEDDSGGNNAYTSFNYFLKTPHSHVASGYNSQSRQSYLINQPAGPSRSASSNGGGRSSSSPASSTGRKVPSEPGHKTIVYTSSSVSSSSTARPKTVVVVRATSPPPKSASILKPKTLATPRSTTTTTTTPLPPPKYELDDQYDEYYDDEDYTVEQQQVPPPSTSSKGSSSSSYDHYPPSPPVSKAALISSTSSSSASSAGRRDSYDFRDARSSKGIANAGQTIINTSGGSGSSAKASKVSVAISSQPSSSSSSPLSSGSSAGGGGIKVISSEFVGNNSTEEPYYYEDDYPDDITLQQQQQEQLRYGSTPSSSSGSKGTSISSSSPSSVKSRGSSGESTGASSKSTKSAFSSSSSGGGRDTSDYYDDDTGVNVNVHDHHFTHVDVPRIPYAKPNVPRVLVTNGKPFLPRLRRQSHHHLYYSHSPQLPAHANNKKKGRSLQTSSEELRQEARAKAREWGKDQFR